MSMRTFAASSSVEADCNTEDLEPDCHALHPRTTRLALLRRDLWIDWPGKPALSGGPLHVSSGGWPCCLSWSYARRSCWTWATYCSSRGTKDQSLAMLTRGSTVMPSSLSAVDDGSPDSRNIACALAGILSMQRGKRFPRVTSKGWSLLQLHFSEHQICS